MSKLSLAEQQQKTKPKIEDVIVKILDGERQQSALEFVAYLREQKLNPRWTATNAWWVKYKGKNLFSIRLHGNHGAKVYYGLEPGSWHTAHWLDMYLAANSPEQFDDLVNCDSFKEFLWSNMHPCKHCLCCKPGLSGVYFGKVFSSTCGVRIENSDAEGLEHTKKLIEYKKKVIVENSTK